MYLNPLAVNELNKRGLNSKTENEDGRSMKKPRNAFRNIPYSPANAPDFLGTYITDTVHSFMCEKRKQDDKSRHTRSLLLGEHRHIFVHDGNIVRIIKAISSVPNNLDHATFEIKVFSSRVQTHLQELSQYTRKLKIHFRYWEEAEVVAGHYRFVNIPLRQETFVDLMEKTISILKRAPVLYSLYLDFNNSTTTLAWAFIPCMGIRGVRALSELKNARILSRLYLDLAGHRFLSTTSDKHDIDGTAAGVLSELYESETLCTISLQLSNEWQLGLNNEHSSPKLGVLELTKLENANRLTSLHLGLSGVLRCPRIPWTAANVIRNEALVAEMCRTLTHSPSLRKLYLDLSESGIGGTDGGYGVTKTLAALDLHTLHIDLGMNRIGAAGIAVLNETVNTGKFKELRCDLPPTPNQYIGKSGFMDKSVRWNEGPFR
jgi:hypothetical protein